MWRLQVSEKPTFREWCKSIKEIITQDQYGEGFYKTVYKDGSVEKLLNDGSIQTTESPYSLEDLKRMFQEETGQSW